MAWQKKAWDKGTQPVVYIMAEASANRTANDPVYLTLGVGAVDGLAKYVDVSISNDAAVHQFAVCKQDATSGQMALYAIEGRTKVTLPSINTTAGDGLRVTTGALIDSTSPFSAAGVLGQAIRDVGIIEATAIGATSGVVCLHGLRSTSA